MQYLINPSCVIPGGHKRTFEKATDATKAAREMAYEYKVRVSVYKLCDAYEYAVIKVPTGSSSA